MARQKIQVTERTDMVPRQRKLYNFSAPDGFLINAVLVSGEFRTKRDLHNTPIVLIVHGVLGHFLARGTPRLLPNALVERGISSLSINTRLAFTGQIFGGGIFDDSLLDIDAAVDALTGEGFKKIYVLGWSLGANITVYYAVRGAHKSVKGIILEGCSSSLPLSHKRRLDKWQSIPSYEHIYDIAKKVLKPDPSETKNDRIFVVYRAWGPSFGPSDCEMFSYRTWWYMRSPEAQNAKTNEIIAGVKVPVLFIHGENDDVVAAEEVNELLGILKKSGNGKAELRFVPGAKHDCMENPSYTVDSVVEWINKSAGAGKKKD